MAVDTGVVFRDCHVGGSAIPLLRRVASLNRSEMLTCLDLSSLLSLEYDHRVLMVGCRFLENHKEGGHHAPILLVGTGVF